jgi:DnaJ-class molecular chaperone
VPPSTLLPGWAAGLLTEEQRRAFEVLDMDLLADEDELTLRYRTLAMRNHPDRGGNPRRMLEINRAFETLRPLSGS